MTLIGGAAEPVTVTNVGNGTVATGSTDAVNGGQLAATNANVTANATMTNSVINGQAGVFIPVNNLSFDPDKSGGGLMWGPQVEWRWPQSRSRSRLARV